MTPVLQTRTGIGGNCWQAALASLLDPSLSEVPDFANAFEDWMAATDTWLRERGRALLWLCVGLDADVTAFVRPRGVHLRTGPTVNGIPHAQVWEDDRLAHDPNPGGCPIVRTQALYFVVPAAVVPIEAVPS